MAQIDEISPDVYRICVYVPEFDLQFNHFLVKDDEPLLFHTGFKALFPQILEAVKTLIDPSQLRWISFSHFESDECGSLNQWLEASPSAQTISGIVGVLVNLNDFATRQPRIMSVDEVLNTGKYRFRLYPTPHLPHGWDAAVLFEETNSTLLCSDLFHQIGKVKSLIDSEPVLIERVRNALSEYQKGPFMNYQPYTQDTKRILKELSALKPKTLAIMHGSSFVGNCEQALLDLDSVMREIVVGS